ncbi:hypothetical protein BG011_006843 [Mortierella polycephala]|uniref:SCD domain-containing protein n=1 Tax=Mortierella polycephala TaxID=41804 RepID=A0A9P6TZG2_9FUNG|nr:hypothetical protein BG011_006843 [Mortierella polycephala]
MTRPQNKPNSTKSTESVSVATSRRSTRTKSQPTTLKSSKAEPTPTRSKVSVSKDDVVDSDDAEAEEDGDEEQDELEEGDEEEEEETLVRRPRTAGPRPVAASTRTKPGTNGTKSTPRATATRSKAIVAETHEKDDDDEEDEESSSSSDDADDSGSDFEEPSQKRKTKVSTEKKSRQSKAAAIFKPRKSNTMSKASKATRTSKASVARKNQKSSVESNGDAASEEEQEQSELYSAVLDSQVALDTVAADWISLYEQSSDEALLNLTNFLIRSCGCTQAVSAEEFGDEDNMIEVLKDILLRYKENTANFDYPIVSKAKEFKKFKKNLLELYTRLIQKALGDILFDGVFMEALLNWTISLSSSTFRPVRHTATVVALNIASSLAEYVAELQDELNVTNRQLATSQKQKAAQKKIKQLEKKVAEGQARKADVLKWIDEIFESVFVLRCRDVDPLVRSDCVRELGKWMVANPDYFIASSYLLYLGWAVSDKAAMVRLEALKVLAKLYENENQASALRTFTAKLTDRVVDMAVGESDTAARLGAIRVATLIHKHGQLEEEDQVKLSTLIFGANAKVRKALAKFVKAHVWENEVEGRLATCELLVSSPQSEETQVKKNWIELKSLVSFLITVGKTDREQGEAAAHEEDHEDVAGSRLFEETKAGRIALAVEALWSEIEALKDWKSIAEYLIKDHSSTSVASSSKGSQSKPATLEDCYHLEEEEENVLLEVLVASLQLTLRPPVVPGFLKDKVKLKAQQDDLSNEVGRYCVDILPQLLLKYGADASRIRSVLVIPQLMPLNVYLDMRMLTTYEELVDEVIKVFKRHSDPSVLHTAAITLRTMQGYEILRSSHEAKIDALGESVVDTFLALTSNTHDGDMGDRDQLEKLTLCLRRLEHLIKCTDVTQKKIQSTDQDPFNSVLKVIERYKGVQGHDAELLISALSISFLWVSWVCRGIVAKCGQNSDWTEQDALDVLQMQESLVSIVSDLAIKEGQNVDSRVRRRAFQVLGDLYWLFGGDMFHVSKGVNRHRLFMTCPESTQTECEDFVRTEIELWSEKVKEKMKALRTARTPKATQGTNEEDEELDSDDENNAKDNGDPSEILEDERLAAAQIEQEDKYEMFGTVFSFMRQIILKDFSMDHATTVIAHYGRFGVEFDEGVKRVVAAIKSQTSEGVSRPARDRKAEIFMEVCLDSLKESFELFVDGQVQSTNQVMQLTKVLSTAIKPPGFMHLTKTGIDQRLVWNLHRRGVVYAMEKIAAYIRIEDHQKKAKMIKFFDPLGVLLFGIQPTVNEITSVQEMIESERANKELEVTEDNVWDPLRTYQTKLEKLQQKAADQAAARVKAKEAAQTHEAQAQLQQVQEQERQQDVEMQVVVDNQKDNARVEEIHDTIVEKEAGEGNSAAQGNGSGKKRLAISDDEEEANEVVDNGAEDGDQQRQNRAGSAGSDGESLSSFQSLTVKETKRIRVE